MADTLAPVNPQVQKPAPICFLVGKSAHLLSIAPAFLGQGLAWGVSIEAADWRRLPWALTRVVGMSSHKSGCRASSSPQHRPRLGSPHPPGILRTPPPPSPSLSRSVYLCSSPLSLFPDESLPPPPLPSLGLRSKLSTLWSLIEQIWAITDKFPACM